MESLTPQQVMVIGFVAALVAQVVKVFAARSGKPVDRVFITVFLVVASVILAYLFARPALPAWPAFTPDDPVGYMGLVLGFFGQLVAVASGVIGFATGIYNLLLQKVFDRLGAGKELIKKLAAGKDDSADGDNYFPGEG